MFARLAGLELERHVPVGVLAAVVVCQHRQHQRLSLGRPGGFATSLCFHRLILWVGVEAGIQADTGVVAG
jgi:hypothetical protein